MRNVSGKSFRQNKNIFYVQIFFRKSCLLWDNFEKYGRARRATDDSIIQRMRFACWITKATVIHLEYVILNTFPRQQWLRERAAMFRFTVKMKLCTF